MSEVESLIARAPVENQGIMLEENCDNPHQLQDAESPLDNNETAWKLCSRRMELANSLEKRRASLSPHEISFVKQLLKSGGDAEIKALEHSLRDDSLFFESDDMTKLRDDHENRQHKHRGSVRRQARIEKRKQCQTQAEIWKRASLKVMANNRMSKTTPTAQQSQKFDYIDTVPEEEEQCRSDTDSILQTRETSDNTANFRQDTEGVKLEMPQHRRQLLTRRASENLYCGEGFEVGDEELFSLYSTPQYDPWDEETDRAGHAFDFHILGTSHYDQSALPHVLSPPIMHALQSALPMQHRGESFWLKYSLVRDGASIVTLLKNLRGSPTTLMAMETVDGEVFGAFTSSTWTIQPSFYGAGSSFLWRMTHSRAEVATSVMEQAKRETDLEIFPLSGLNRYEQVCHEDKLAVGGGTPVAPHAIATGVTLHPQEFGFGIAFDGSSLIEASSEACITFNSPPLSNIHSDGSKFELVNLEVWALTPCITEEEARRMEFHHLFLKRHATCSF